MYRVFRNSLGKVDSINRISDGATVNRSDTASEITKAFNTWYAQNPSFDISDKAVETSVIDVLRNARKIELQNACTATIENGFTSSALGSPHIYMGRPRDQANMNSAATLSTLKKLTTKLTCTNVATGVRAPIAHSQDQAQSVLRDFKTVQEAALDKYRAKINQLNAATTVAQINAVVW